MPIAQILLASGSSASPTPTYTLTPATTSTNEGSSLTLTVGGTNIPDGTYYWTIGSGSEDFVTTDGTVSVTSNSGSFTVTPTADATTEGSQTFIVALREGSTGGTILASSGSITINDTSLTPVAPFSLEFNQPQQDFLRVDASSAFNLGNNWTMEFWIRSNNNSASNINIPGGQWGLINQGGWYYGMANDNSILVGLAGGNLSINQSSTGDIQFAEPTTQLWTHVAIVNNGGGSAQKVYYNGVEQAKVSGSYTSNGKTNTSDDIYIGRLAPNYSSHFDGKMAMIRISNTAKYSATFTPTVTYGVEADTKLFLDSDTPLIGQSYYELNGITTSQTNGSTIYFSKTTYPNLNNQVQSGDTVVDTSTSDSSTVTAAVYTADPDNWGIDVSSYQGSGTKNFSGTRSAPVTNNGVTESTTFVNRYTALHSASNEGSSGIHIDTNPTNDAWAGSVPVGATIISQFTGRFTVAARGRDSNNNWFFSVDGSNNFTAGETHTFIW
jgi:hypothetical protein